MGRPIMNEPLFVLSAAAHYGVAAQFWPQQYHSGRNLATIMAEQQNEEMLGLRRGAKPPNPSEALAIAIARGEVLASQGK